ncbi:thioredoxin family protein [Marinitoga lauensis]|uniref:thioredoxin family protein n=1 Tax=Marinitoga lauensis TaxID=2201189 RepID=UPI0010123C35|nr:thioredoxin fold domain-containing protein [Marinitoga lauensis]
MKKFMVLLILMLTIITYSAIKLERFVVDDFNIALKLGEITDKNVIVMFSSKSCYYCKKFKSEVLTDDKVQEWLRTEFVFAEIYAEKDKKAMFKGKMLTYIELFGAFGVRGTPTFFFFDSKGEPLAQLPGFVEKDTFLSILKYFVYSRTNDIKYQDFVKKNIDVNIKNRVLKLDKEKIDYLLNNDPNTMEYNKNIKDEYINVVLDKKDKKLEDEFYVVIYEK